MCRKYGTGASKVFTLGPRTYVVTGTYDIPVDALRTFGLRPFQTQQPDTVDQHQRNGEDPVLSLRNLPKLVLIELQDAALAVTCAAWGLQ